VELRRKQVGNAILYGIAYRAFIAAKRTLDHFLFVLFFNAKFKGPFAQRASQYFHEVFFHYPSCLKSSGQIEFYLMKACPVNIGSLCLDIALPAPIECQG